jgi:hypothetical protein
MSLGHPRLGTGLRACTAHVPCTPGSSHPRTLSVPIHRSILNQLLNLICLQSGNTGSIEFPYTQERIVSRDALIGGAIL